MSTENQTQSNNETANGNGDAAQVVSLPAATFTLTKSEFIAFLKTLTGKRGGITQMSRQWGVDNSELSKVLRGKQEPGPKLLKAVGARVEKVYQVTVETEAK